MISLEQWRSVIGRFAFKSRKAKTAKKKKCVQKGKVDDWSDLCGRLFILSLTFWCFHFEQQLISQFLDSSSFSKIEALCDAITSSLCSNFDLLLQASDIELNPGPDTLEHQFNAFGNHLMSQFSEMLNNKFGELQASFGELQASHGEIKEQLSSINETVSAVKEDLQKVNRRLTEVEDDQQLHRLDIDHCAELIGRVEERLHEVEKKTEHQEQYSRRENVILHDMPEQDDESFQAVSKRVVDLFNNNVKDKKWQESDISRAHRLGNHSAKKPRPVIVRFNQFQDKLTALKAREELKKAGIGIASDLTILQRKELASLRDKNQRGYYKNGILKVVPMTQDQTSVKFGGAARAPVLPSHKK